LGAQSILYQTGVPTPHGKEEVEWGIFLPIVKHRNVQTVYLARYKPWLQPASALTVATAPYS